jgi:MFS family permease
MAEIAAIGTTAPPEVAPPHAPPERLDFDIVPRKGLILVAIVFAALIVAIAVNKLWPLVFLHVSFGAAWTIIDLFLGLVLGPIMGSMPVPARIAFVTRLMPKMLLIMPVVVTVTLAAGWQLGTFLGTVTSAYPDHGWLVASYIVVGIMAIIALGLLEPANVAVLVELKKPRPNPLVIERLMKRFIYSAGIIGVMQVATLVIMTKIASG